MNVIDPAKAVRPKEVHHLQWIYHLTDNTQQDHQIILGMKDDLVDLFCPLITVAKPNVKSVPHSYVQACKIIACRYKYKPDRRGTVHFYGDAYYCLYPNLIVAISDENHSVC